MEDDEYVLRLYVVRMSSRSVKAINNIKRICEEYLLGRYRLEIIDIYLAVHLCQRWPDSRCIHPHKRASTIPKEAHRQHVAFQDII